MKNNVLLITSDQQHYMTLGINNPEIKTPNLDRLAKMGITMDRTYCPNPTCTPTRASIITGKYPSGHGAWTLGTKLDENTRTIGDVLLENGYETALIGKAHFQPLFGNEKYESIEAYPKLQDLDFWKNYKERFYGFNHIELLRNHTTESHVGQHYALWLEAKGFKNWRDWFLEPTGNMKVTEHMRIEEIIDSQGTMENPNMTWGKWDIPVGAHYNTWIAERTNQMIVKCKDDNKPFFIWSSFPDPHPEYFVPEPYASMYDPQEITLKIKQDNEVTNPLVEQANLKEPNFETYKETGYAIHGCHSHIQDEDSLRKDVAIYYGMVTFMDEYIGKILDCLEENNLFENTLIMFTTDHGHYFGQHGLIRKGPFHFEDAIKVPFIASVPGMKEVGLRSNAINSLVDITPTILDFLNIDIPVDMSGISQLDVYSGNETFIRKWAICEHHHEPNLLNMRTYVNERYKITVYQDRDFGDLFDLENDPDELNNLWNDEEYKDLKMELLLKYISAELSKEPISMPRIANA